LCLVAEPAWRTPVSRHAGCETVVGANQKNSRQTMRNRAAQTAKQVVNKGEDFSGGMNRFMRLRSSKERRQRNVRGVTGYDRRKRQRRKSLDSALAFAPTHPREFAALSAAYSYFSIYRRPK